MSIFDKTRPNQRTFSLFKKHSQLDPMMPGDASLSDSCTSDRGGEMGIYRYKPIYKYIGICMFSYTIFNCGQIFN